MSAPAPAALSVGGGVWAQVGVVPVVWLSFVTSAVSAEERCSVDIVYDCKTPDTSIDQTHLYGARGVTMAQAPDGEGSCCGSC